MKEIKSIYACSIVAVKGVISTTFYNSTESLTFVIENERNDTRDFIKFVTSKVKGVIGFNNLRHEQYFLKVLSNLYTVSSYYNKILEEVDEVRRFYAPGTNNYFKSQIPQLDLTHIINTKGKSLSLIAYSNNLKISDIDPFQNLTTEEVMESSKIKAESIWGLYELNRSKLKVRGLIKRKIGLDFATVNEADIVPKLIRKLINIPFKPTTEDDRPVMIQDILLSKNDFTSKEMRSVYEYFSSKTIIKTRKELDFKVLFKSIQINYSTAGFYASVEPSIHEGKIYNVDVVQFYPSILNNYNIFPEGIGPEFNDAYRKSIDILDGNHKLSLNAVIGKFNKPGNPLYDKKAWLTVSINAQLIFSKFIEALAATTKTLKILSIKTDGIYFSLSSSDDYYNAIETIADWQDYSGFDLKYSSMDKLVIRDANNILGIKKGEVVAATGLFKKFKAPIVRDALINYFSGKMTAEATIINKKNSILDYALIQSSNNKISNFKTTEDGIEVLPKSFKYIVVKSNGFGLSCKGISAVRHKRIINKPAVIVNHNESVEESNIDIDYIHYLTLAFSIIKKIEHKQQKLF